MRNDHFDALLTKVQNNSIDSIDFYDTEDFPTNTQMSRLCNALKTNRSVHTLDFSRDPDGDMRNFMKRDIEHIVTIFESNVNQTVRNLYFDYHVNLGNRSFLSVLNSLKQHSAIEEVSFAGGNIDDGCTEGVKSFLTANTGFKSLIIKSSNLGRQFMTGLAQVLNETGLEKLDLTSNSIDNEGLVQFSRALEANTTLTSLNLDYNEDLNEQGFQSVLDTLRLHNNATLTEFSAFYDDQPPAVENIVQNITEAAVENVRCSHLAPR